jgi:hypothetical protein
MLKYQHRSMLILLGRWNNHYLLPQKETKHHVVHRYVEAMRENGCLHFATLILLCLILLIYIINPIKVIWDLDVTIRLDPYFLNTCVGPERKTNYKLGFELISWVIWNGPESHYSYLISFLGLCWTILNFLVMMDNISNYI